MYFLNQLNTTASSIAFHGFIQTLRLDASRVGIERMVADGNSAFGGGQFLARCNVFIAKRFGAAALETSVE